MNLSRPFIERPVATTLLTLALALLGLIAFRFLPVSSLPRIDFPVVSVQASLPGASPEDMAADVATPLERTIGQIASVNEITSQSTLGSTRINVQFDLERNIDGAARDIQGAINAARTLLPTGLPSNPTYRKVNPAEAPVLILSLSSKSLSLGQLYDAASTILAQKISQVDGVGQVQVAGSSLPAVRIDINPQALAAMGISPESVRTVIAQSNVNRPKGFVELSDLRWQIQSNDQAKSAKDFAPLIIAWKNNVPIRLKDVATVTDSVQDMRNIGLSNGVPAVILLVSRQPGANVIETVERVLALMPILEADIPASADLTVVIDRTPTIRASLKEVERTLLLSTSLVILVVYLFLRSLRATTIPLVVVPVSLIGTFAVMYLMKLSIDNLSLMALTVATGFVVDDAIVVLENIQRHIEEGTPPFKAALDGAREVSFTVVSISLSLVVVFLPILAMGGLVGRIFNEFAVVISAAIVVSLLVSLTTTPALCSGLLKPMRDFHHQHNSASLERSARGLYGGLLRLYGRGLRFSLRHKRWLLASLLLVIGLNVYLYMTIPKGFFPQQDVGRLIGQIQADQSISFQAMQDKLQRYIRIIREDPAVDNAIGFTGGAQRNGGTIFVSLKSRAARDASADQVINRLRKPLGQIPGGTLYLQAVQDLRMGGRQGNAQYQYTLQADNLAELREWAPKVLAALQKEPTLADVSMDQQDKGISNSLLIDRDQASRLGVSPQLLDSTLNDLYGQRQISIIYNPLNQYQVVMEADPSQLESPTSLDRTFVVNGNGQSIPLAGFVTRGVSSSALAVNHQGQFAAATYTFNLPPGVVLGDALKTISASMDKLGVPKSILGGFQGTAKVFQDSQSSQPLLILGALLAIYLVLGMLYESLIHPFTILSTLPSAGIGALLALQATHIEFTLIALIGVLLLIGIVKKNAIMMIDFALSWQRSHGSSAEEAIYEAAIMRFRPIMMTTLAALLGAVPLALGTGEGSELRQPLGISIMGGLIVSQLLTLFTTPVVYLYLDRLRRPKTARTMTVQ